MDLRHVTRHAAKSAAFGKWILIRIKTQNETQNETPSETHVKRKCFAFFEQPLFKQVEAAKTELFQNQCPLALTHDAATGNGGEHYINFFVHAQLCQHFFVPLPLLFALRTHQ